MRSRSALKSCEGAGEGVCPQPPEASAQSSSHLKAVLTRQSRCCNWPGIGKVAENYSAIFLIFSEEIKIIPLSNNPTLSSHEQTLFEYNRSRYRMHFGVIFG
jgi:hypothetical protein